MTSFRQKRCGHCRAPYACRMSGNGCQDPLNEGTYCPDCKRVVLEALIAVPPKFEKVIEPVDISFDMVKGWYDEDETQRASRRAEGQLVMRRLSMPLYDLDDPDNRYIAGYVQGRGRWDAYLFQISYWTKRGDPQVTTELEKNLQTGEIRPWRNYS